MAWWDGGGTIDNCVAAYDAIGAASLADSYIDESGNGNDAAVVVSAPAWAAGVGWTGNASNVAMRSPVVWGAGYSIICRCTGLNNGGFVFGCWEVSNRFMGDNQFGGRIFWQNGAQSAGPFQTGGVLAICGKTAYYNGSFSANIGAGAEPTLPVGILCRNRFPGFGTQDAYSSATIAALAIYSDTLSAVEVATITANMNALPNYSEGTPSLIMAQQRAFFRGGVPIG